MFINTANNNIDPPMLAIIDGWMLTFSICVRTIGRTTSTLFHLFSCINGFRSLRELSSINFFLKSIKL